jgi:hypothetical protein
VHEKTLQECRSQKNPLRIRRKSSGGVSVFIRAVGEAQELRSSQRRKGEQRLRPLRNLEILPSLGRKCRSSGGSNNSRQIGWRERDLDRWFYVQEELRRSLQKEEIGPLDLTQKSRQPVGSGEDDQSLASGGEHKEKGSEPSDLEQIPVSHRIGQELHEGYHRDISHREIGILEDKKIETLQVSKHRRSGPSVSGDTWRRSSARRYFGASGNWHSRGQRSGKSMVEKPE